MDIKQDYLPTEEQVFVLFDDGEVSAGFFQWDDYPKRIMKFSDDHGGYYDVAKIERWVLLEDAKKLVFNS